MDGFPGGKGEGPAQDMHGLGPPADQVHFDAPRFGGMAGLVAKAVQVEVAENDRGEVETTANGGAPETADKKTTPDDAAAKFIKAKKRPEPAQ